VSLRSRDRRVLDRSCQIAGVLTDRARRVVSRQAYLSLEPVCGLFNVVSENRMKKKEDDGLQLCACVFQSRERCETDLGLKRRIVSVESMSR